MDVIADYSEAADLSRLLEVGHHPLTAEEREALSKAANVFARRISGYQDSLNSNAVKGYLASKLGARKREIFSMLFLDSKNRVIEYEEIFKGSLSSIVVQPRICVQKALEYNCSKVILAHNHTGPCPKPSPSDFDVTDKLEKALALISVPVIDHVIVAGGKTYSFKENGHI